MSRPARASWPALLALLACALLWSLNGVLIKALMAPREGFDGASGLAIACYRSLLGGVVFLPLAYRRLSTLRRVRVGWPIGSVLLFTIMTLSFVVATTKTAAANAIILQYTSPIWVFALSPILLHERPRLSDGLVLLLAMVGVAVIFAGNENTASIWLLLALLSGFGFGALTVTLRGLRRVDPLVVACLNTVGSGLVLAAPLALTGTWSLSPTQWVMMVTMALGQFTIPYVLFSWALQRIEAHQAALILLLEPLLNPLWCYLVMDERIPPATMTGGVLILLSVSAWLLLGWRREDELPLGTRAAPSPAFDRNADESA